MSALGQATSKCLDSGAALEISCAVTVANIRSVNGCLNIKPPIDDADQRLGHITNDPRATRRANNKLQFVVNVKDHGRCHGTARTLARLYPVCHQRPVTLRHKREIRKLVVEQKSPNHKR